jgi:hypothetical protein
MLHCAEVRREEKEQLIADKIISIRIEFSNGLGRWMGEQKKGLTKHGDEQGENENKAESKEQQQELVRCDRRRCWDMGQKWRETGTAGRQD